MRSTLPLAPSGIFRSIQGEGHLRGGMQVFIRLAGCSVGCAGCDTDYSVNERLSAGEIVERVLELRRPGEPWVWITGGEPSDHDLTLLVLLLHGAGLSVAVATSGRKAITAPVEWLSVSYHGGYTLAQDFGHELKLVDGLGPWSLGDCARQTARSQFWFRYVQPFSSDGQESRESLQRCLHWIDEHPGWSLSRQDHHMLGLA